MRRRSLVTSLLDEHLYAVVNVNAFDNVAPSLLRPQPVSFEGERRRHAAGTQAAQLDRQRPLRRRLRCRLRLSLPLACAGCPAGARVLQ